MKYFFCCIFALSLTYMLHAQEPVKTPEKTTTIPDKITPADSTSDDDVFLVVENQPEFPGGADSMMQYIQKNISYPPIGDSDVEGTVFVSCIIELDGNISNVEVKRGIGDYYNKEAMRVVQSMPAWKPGYQAGKPVRVKMFIPVRFILH